MFNNIEARAILVVQRSIKKQNIVYPYLDIEEL